MTKYVVESTHTPEECLQALDKMLEKGEDVLKQFAFGCKSGEHTGWAYIDADSKEEALKIVPEFLRDKACIHEVSIFTPEEIRAAHEKV
ncbi:hypothetical protein ANME2D_00721 [Candidatus Methanoperedens nitroreducens]|uniref:DUF4242 domain-containing protein n=1 Tax=Candidatus Methanoperedens nitratireducens TaxID=1392998 RepID=A0A062VDA8_9EURY|nr:hypothetical protein [Candidatus Methanoperedens nitroreducens]KCZ73649.1 hypothetical protein ANME2D_00721 [Candidatus Methanoperedens nitroreducens]MDJ1422391.1 hypothetical protein [Candidatus Methanoperedens sp.]